MIAWRLISHRHQHESLTGKGAKLYGGRWNQPGVAAVYCCETLSLALLEWAVHADLDIAPESIVAHQLYWPDSLPVEQWDVEQLPANWAQLPAPASTQTKGSQWLRSGRTVALRVPSAVVDIEHCWVLNPEHEDFRQVVVQATRVQTVDRRLGSQ